MTKILTQAQAEAVYSAMCALNNVNGRVQVEVDDIIVEEKRTGVIQIIDWSAKPSIAEHYASQASFASFYDLQQG